MNALLERAFLPALCRVSPPLSAARAPFLRCTCAISPMRLLSLSYALDSSLLSLCTVYPACVYQFPSVLALSPTCLPLLSACTISLIRVLPCSDVLQVAAHAGACIMMGSCRVRAASALGLLWMMPASDLAAIC